MKKFFIGIIDVIVYSIAFFLSIGLLGFVTRVSVLVWRLFYNIV